MCITLVPAFRFVVDFRSLELKINEPAVMPSSIAMTMRTTINENPFSFLNPFISRFPYTVIDRAPGLTDCANQYWS